MVAGILYRVQFGLGISRSCEVLDGFSATFWIHPVGISIYPGKGLLKGNSQ
jgi:hypothetical protein